MIFLKSLIILALNIFAGYLIAYLIKVVLVLPKDAKYIGKKHIPLTPGLIIRLRNKYYYKLEKLLEDYFRDADNEKDLTTKIAEWESKAYQKGWDKFEKIEDVKFLPQNFKNKIHHWLALIFYELTKQFLRKFIPFLLDKYQAQNHILRLGNLVSKYVIVEFYDKYIHKFLIIFFLIISGIVGIFNLIFVNLVY